MRAASGKQLQRADTVGRFAANPPARESVQRITAGHDSDTMERRLHGSLTELAARVGKAGRQQAAYQLSGNGMSGQASPLSLAALGG
jgi:hypothetical protein